MLTLQATLADKFPLSAFEPKKQKSAINNSIGELGVVHTV
jgi:hypothetical protein